IFVLSYYIALCLMTTSIFLEQDNASFSKILLSKEVAEIIKQVIRETADTVLHQHCYDRKNSPKVNNL
ncbi:MAG: hypothetical protein OPY08_05120, partial [Nitrosopumilus sp.]|nr:hypothetical protein [Nitrosopumilus sp.]MDF2426500.1 hypothetical protein [Nitrosopumilus sp.]MDF2429103.1 hypothetical protein [Nitrosopumilus sp.]